MAMTDAYVKQELNLFHITVIDATNLYIKLNTSILFVKEF